MDVDPEELAKTYSEYTDEKLLSMASSGDLTEIAIKVINNELSQRGVPFPQPRKEEITKKHKIKSNANRMKRRKLLVIGIIGFILLILVGIGGLGFWGVSIFFDHAKEALNNNSVILQHIGEVDQIEVDLNATGQAEGEDVFVFRIGGSKGTGVVTAEFVTVDADTEEIRSGTIRLSSGETYDLLTQNLPSQDDEADR